MSNKRGFTLIEVIVSLGILTMVFASVITLISAVMGLAVLTRDNTIAASLAQKHLSEAVSTIKKGGDPTFAKGHFWRDNEGFDYSIDISTAPKAPINSAKFKVANVTIYWSEKNSLKSFSVKQVVELP